MSQFVQWSNFSKIAPYAELFRQGIVVTVLLSVFTVAIGFCIALILALMRMSNVRPFRALGLDKDGHMREGGPLVWISRFNPLSFLATAYVEILRSTPVIVQVFIIYYGVFGIVQLPSFQIFGFIKFSRFFPGVVALGMNSGAYLCEIMRAGIQSIDQGQTEAGRSSGNHGQLHGAGQVSTKEQKIHGRKAKLPVLCFLNLSAHFYVWVTVWVRRLTHILTHT